MTVLWMLFLFGLLRFSCSHDEESYIDLDEMTIEMNGDTSTSQGAPQQQQEPEDVVDTTSTNRKNRKVDWVQKFQAKLVRDMPHLKPSSAKDVATMLQFAAQDPDTKVLLKQLQEENQQQPDDDDKLSRSQIVEGLVQTLSDLQMSELLFREPKKGLQQLKDQGLLSLEKVQLYENDPSLLLHDTRRSLYFHFVELAAQGGYL